MMAGLKSSLRRRYFEFERTCPFLEEKSRDEFRPDIFEATAPRRMSVFYIIFSTVRMWAIDSNPNLEETNESAETLAMAHTYVAKSMISARRDFGGIFIETQMLPRTST